ncbi:hypothetical protein SAMN05216360_11959 [Methylobacterium phyllostachyos]|uniref:Uncharacterized protein n=1 Tax=Methylobacterium phyllostachyos TaxID=582672 RepID=A0A1H0IKY0_9HYPH|nr:hypothetical protein [Methylobacterium phyllostachyos]SDO31986.1 hypothetical protein SAMN05216360_11959 [Methylobacterium phyllostachyos]
MLVSALTLRRCLLLGLMLVSLVKLADGIARYELRRATGAITYAADAGSEASAD